MGRETEKQRDRVMECFYFCRCKNRTFNKYDSFDFEKITFERDSYQSVLICKMANCRCFVTILNWFTAMYLYLSSASNCTVHKQTLTKKQQSSQYFSITNTGRLGKVTIRIIINIIKPFKHVIKLLY